VRVNCEFLFTVTLVETVNRLRLTPLASVCCVWNKYHGEFSRDINNSDAQRRHYKIQ
jgi:hypothetical protein